MTVGEGKLQTLLFWDRVWTISVDLELALCAAQTALELRIFLSPLLRCWEYRHALLYPTIGFIVLFLGEIQNKTSEDKSYKKCLEIYMAWTLFFMYLYIYISCLSVFCKRTACCSVKLPYVFPAYSDTSWGMVLCRFFIFETESYCVALASLDLALVCVSLEIPEVYQPLLMEWWDIKVYTAIPGLWGMHLVILYTRSWWWWCCIWSGF